MVETNSKSPNPLPVSSHRAQAYLAGEGRQELLYQTERTLVFWHYAADGTGPPVLCQQPLGPGAPKRLRSELAVLARLADIDGVPQLSRALAPAGAIALSDSAAGLPLAQTAAIWAQDWARFVRFAARLTDIVSLVHRCGVVHCNINPDSVLVRPGVQPEPLLAQFDLATTFAEEQPAFTHTREIAGRLAYLAPEQTGRTGRHVDQRADLYGLGATLYEAASGRPPFANGDPLRLVHEVLVAVPRPLLELVPGVPHIVSEVIQRLLEKEPDRRYQSADGLAHDLARVGESLARGMVETFGLGERDPPRRLSAPSRLIGRETEISGLRRAFEDSFRGKSRGALVSGPPGVGKSALINELRPVVTALGGWFVRGKFDQHRQERAADGVNQTTRALGRLLLAEPEAELTALRARILAALGPSAGIIAGRAPEFALLLGEPAESPVEDSVAGESRLFRAGIDLLRAIASPARPLVMVLDDLQWAMPIHFRYFDVLLAADDLPGLFLVGGFRAAEVDAMHPLSPMLARWRRADPGPLLLTLANLPPTDLGAFLAEMMRLPAAQAARLADLLAPRTGGNPYDTVELVNALRRDGALVAAADGWRWDDATIRRHVGQGDVIDLLVARIERLPTDTKALLDVTACLGGEVELGLLGTASGLSAALLEERLGPALEDGLLVMVRGGEGAVRFCHDRVQQAAYGRVLLESRRALHLSLGRRLSARPELGALAAEQYLLTLDALVEPEELSRVAGLFRRAAMGASVGNTLLAERFLVAALGLVGVPRTASDAALRVALEIDRHAVLYRLARLAEADQLFASIERTCADPLALVEPACVQINSLCNRGRQGEALELGFALLTRLGFAGPGPDRMADIARGIDRLFAWFSAGEHARDFSRAEIADAGVKATAQLIKSMMAPAFFQEALLAFWLSLESQRLWAEHGPCAALVGPLSYAGFISVAFRDDYRTGGGVVRHVLAVSEAKHYQAESALARFLFSVSVAHWSEPLEDCLLHARRAHEGLLQAGDLQNAAFTYWTTIFALFDSAPTLEAAVTEAESALAFLTRTGNEQVRAHFMPYRQIGRALRGETVAPGSFTDPSFDELIAFDQLVSNARAGSHIVRALSAALFGDDKALAFHAAKALPLLSIIPGGYTCAQAYLLQGLSLAQRARAAPAEQRAGLLAELEACRQWLSLRALDAPMNFLQLERLLAAEQAWASGDAWLAAGCFDAALEAVQMRTRLWQEALISERAGLFHLAHGHTHAGRMLLVQAYRCYERWGATGKLRVLAQSHAFLDGPSVAQAASARPSARVSADPIDLLAVLRASQALSSETSLERLKLRVVELLGTMTGATGVHLVLWLEETKGWYLSADDAEQTLTVEAAGAQGGLPLSAFRYVERTREPLLVEDAMGDDRFARDPYLAALECCSLLVVPILSQGALRAVLMLENRLSRGAFSSDRLDAVLLIAGQLTVSLDNALLYASLARKVADRTRELEETHKRLVAISHQSGMAEIATNVLHNVGNVLNSVNVSATLVAESIKRSKIASVAKVSALLCEHEQNLAAFFRDDPRAKQLPGYLTQLAAHLAAEREASLKELGFLRQNVEHIKEIVALQQTYATSSALTEDVDLKELIDESLRMNRGSLSRHRIEVIEDCQDLPRLRLDKRKVLQILVNLISNAKHACDDGGRVDKCVTVRMAKLEGRIDISVSDNGIGIPAENLTRIFQHGFTTRATGHGFGLHSGALAAKALGGSLRVHSGGTGQGATFTLELPLELAQERA